MIQVISREFLNPTTGVTTPVYKANAGDIIRCTYKVLERVYTQNIQGVGFSYDFANFKVFITGSNWLQEGYKVGDLIRLIAYDTTGTVSVTQDRTITAITLTSITLNALTSFDPTYLVNIEGFPVKRDALNIYFNQANSFTTLSQIDGEKTGFKIDGLAAPIVGTNNLQSFGNKSGQFEVTNVTIAPEGTLFEGGGIYTIKFNIIQSGIYDASQFSPSLAYDLVVGFQFFRTNADFNTAQFFIDEYQSNTGWYNVGYSDEPSSGTVTQFIPEIPYNSPDQLTCKIATTDTYIGAGACYVPIDGDYYQNKPESQSDLGFVIETQGFSVATVLIGENLHLGYSSEYEIECVSATSSAGVLTVVIDWTPNFGVFFDDKQGDRLFRLWIKVGNTNHLVFNGQLTKRPTVNSVFTPNFFQLTKFDENITTPISNANPTFILEDNVGALCSIPMVQGDVYDKIVGRVYLEETATGQQIDYEYMNFILANQSQINGAYVAPISNATTNNLASGSAKNTATLTPTTLVGTDYDFILNYPFLINWRYWVQQAPVFFSFYPNLNKNWYNYVTSGFKFYVETQLVASDGSYQYSRKELTFENYEDSGILDTSADLKKADGTIVNNVLDEQMTIVFTIDGTTGGSVLSNERLEFTIEPKESNPRWQISTEYAETNALNPLTIIDVDIAGSVLKATVAIDTTKIDISSGVSLTCETLCDVDGTPYQERQKFTYEYLKLPSIFTEENRGLDECCEVQLKVADANSSDTHKNDKTGVYYKSDGVGGSLSFALYKDGVSLGGITLTSAPKQENGFVGIVNWKDVLTAHGSGCYVIKAIGALSGIAFDFIWGKYQLKQYSQAVVRGQVRLRTAFDKYSSEEDFNFEASGFVDDVRFEGYFGDMQPKTRTEFLVYSDRLQKLITNENVKEYYLYDNFLEPQIFRLTSKNLLLATDIFVSDYNITNPDYYTDENVILSDENTISLEYERGSRGRELKATFKKKLRNERVFKK